MREAGWYWVKWFEDGFWIPARYNDILGFSCNIYGNGPAVIGPKINEPEELCMADNEEEDIGQYGVWDGGGE